MGLTRALKLKSGSPGLNAWSVPNVHVPSGLPGLTIYVGSTCTPPPTFHR